MQNFAFKFQAVAEKTAKNVRGYFILPHPVQLTVNVNSIKVQCRLSGACLVDQGNSIRMYKFSQKLLTSNFESLMPL